MDKSAIIISIFILFNILGIAKNADVLCDKKSERFMDRSAAKLLVVGQKSVKFPENGIQLRTYCNEAKKLVDFITAFSNSCMPNFGKEVTRILMFSFHKELKTVCRSGRVTQKAQELLNSAKCANSALDKCQKCMDNWIDAYQGLLNAEEKLRIPMACCQYHTMLDCLGTESRDVKECTKTDINYINRYINSVLQGVLQFMCYEYTEDNENCDHLVRITPKRNSSVPRYKSILPPTVNIITSLKDF